MKSSKLFLTSLLAAAAMSATAFAETDLSGFSGTIYTWAGRTTSGNDLAFGYYYTTDTSGNFTAATSGASGAWTNVQSIIATDRASATTGPTYQNTLRFVALDDSSFTGKYTAGDKKTPVYTFNPLTLGGIIVESGATGFSISASGGYDRSFMLGNGDGTAAKSVFHESFTLTLNTGNSDTTNKIRGTQTWTIDENKTFTITSGSRALNFTGATTINGGGTAKLSGSNVSFGAGASINIAANTTLDLSGSNVTLSSAIQNSGTVTVTSGTTFNITSLASLKDTEGNYAVISGGTITDWNNVNASNFSLNGTALSGATIGRYTGFAVGTDGKITFTETAANLVWTNAANGTWDTSTRNWTNTSTGAADAFFSYDSVEFNKSGTYTVTVASGGVTADVMNVSAGTVTLGGTNKVTTWGGIFINDGATLKISANTNISGNVTVNSGGTFDLSGNSANIGNHIGIITLNGGSLVNIGAGAGTNMAQIYDLRLSANSTIGGTGQFGIIGSGYAAKTLILGGYTLTKSGTNDFLLANTTITQGTIDIQGGSISVVSGKTCNGSAATFNIGTSGTLNLNGTSLSMAKLTMAGDGTLNLGGGTLTLLGDSKIVRITSAGTVVVSEGKTLTLETGRFNSAAFTVKENAKILLANGSATATIANAFSGAGTMEKTGSGTTTLSVANSFSGGVTVSQGTLVAGNVSALGTGNVLVADDATLARGLSNGSVAIGGTLTTNGAAILSTGALNTDTAAFAVTGAVTLDASTKFELGSIGDGVILLQSEDSIAGTSSLSISNVTLNGAVLGDRSSFTLSSDGKTLSLTQNALALTWAGGDSGTWKTNGSGWTAIDAESPTFQTGDSVEFTNANAGTVSVDGAVSLDTMTVSSGTYTFNAASGGGKIYSMGAVTVANGATMNLNVDAAFGGLVVQNGGSLNVNAAVTTSSALSVDGTLTSSAAVSATQLSGSGTIDLGSTGSLTLSDSAKFNNWTGTIKVGANTGVNGTQSANWNCAEATVEFSGAQGWLEGYNGGTFAANIKLVDTAGGAAGFQWKDGSSTSNLIATLSGKLTGTGTFERENSGFNQSFVFSGNLSEFAGTFKHTNSKNYATLTFGGKTNAIEGIISAADGSVTGTSTINWYQGTLTSSQDKRVYFNYSNDVRSDSTITSAILVKQGAGSLTLTQANTYTGGTTVEAGTLIAANASALGTGAVTVNRDAKLQVKAGMNVTVSTANSTTVTIAEGAKLVIDFAGVDLPAGAEERTFAIMTAAVFSIYEKTLSAGDVTNDMDGAWELLGGDSAWLDSAKWTLADNTLSLTLTIPEPSVFGLLAGLGALALAGTRRRRKKA